MAKKISNGLVTLSSAAILAIYAAGYERTGPAAERFAAQIAQRRPLLPIEEKVTSPAPPSLELPIAAPAPLATKKIATVKAKDASPNDAQAATPIEIPAAQTTPPVGSDPVTAAALAPTDEPAAAATNPPVQYKDGVYLGWGYSRHGNIQAFVRIEGGRIIHAGIERCETRWSCDLVAHLPGQVVARQSAEVDFVTGATQSGDAFYGAIFTALAQAK